MEFTTQAALIIAGIVAIVAGIFGVGFKAGGIEIPKLQGWKQGLLVVAGLLLISLGVVLTPEFHSIMLGGGNGQRSDIAAAQTGETTPGADSQTPSEAGTQESLPMEQDKAEPPTAESEATLPQPAGQPEPAQNNTEYAWISDLVRLPVGVTGSPATASPAGTCARWNMVEHNGGASLPMEILTCTQDGTYLDENSMEHGGLKVGAYERVSGITVRRCQPPVAQAAEAPPAEPSLRRQLLQRFLRQWASRRDVHLP